MWRLALLLLLPPLHRSEECSSFLQTAESKTIEPGEDTQGPTRIPCVIHQVWRKDLPEDAQQKALESWTSKNPLCRHKIWKEQEMAHFVREKSPDVVWPMWIGLSASEREDVFHYLVGFEEGGYMADSGVTCEKPIDQFPVPKNATMIVGYEFGHRFTEVQRKKANFARTEQFAKYFFASAPGNPILKRCLQLVRQRYTWKVQAPQDLTGAATFSDAVHEFLDKNTPEALEHEISIRQNRPSLHFLSYPSERLYGQDDWKLWIFAAGRVNEAPQVAKDDPPEAPTPLLIARNAAPAPAEPAEPEAPSK